MNTFKHAQCTMLFITSILLLVGCGGGSSGGGGGQTIALNQDTDGDGVDDGLEQHGYIFDWAIAKYLPWSEMDVKMDPTVLYFKSDPLQPSSDQDPYPDGMETSDVFMDQAVKPPGDHPMVPAYPDIVAKLECYEVTVNTDITTTTGKMLQNGESWNTDTYDMHTHTTENSWKDSWNMGFSISDVLGFSAGVDVSHTETITDSVQTGTVASHGGSTLESHEWQTATSINPVDAARIKLFVKVYNYGSAPASNIQPTFTLMIGQRNIATFEPGNSQINVLAPGDEYPNGAGVYWTIDTYDTGTGVMPISLTLDELKALETGAPVNLVVTQVLADVLALNKNGYWESVGSWHDYMARIRPTSTRLFFDIGDGNVVDYYVSANDSPSAPKITLRDAILWVAGGHETASEQKIKYFDRVNGGKAATSVEGWSINMDNETWLANDLKEGDNVLDTVLGPEGMIIFKAPISDAPKVHFAYLEEEFETISAYASDYQGVTCVEFIEDMNAAIPVAHEMTPEEGVGYYSFQLTAGYILTGGEAIRVTDLENPAQVTEQLIEVIPDVSNVEPVIESVTFDWNTMLVRAVVSNNSGSPVTDVLFTLDDDDPIINAEMTKVDDNLWEYDLGYERTSGTPFYMTYFDWPDYVSVKATNYVALHASSGVTEMVWFYGWGCSMDMEEGEAIDLDYASSYLRKAMTYNEFMAQDKYDIWMSSKKTTLPCSEGLRFAQHVRFHKMEGKTDKYFFSLDRLYLEEYDHLLQYGDSEYISLTDILLIHTGEHYSKIFYSKPNTNDSFWRSLRTFENP